MKHADIIIPLAVGGVSLAALALVMRGGKPKEISGPTYLKGAVGKRQFELRRVGEGYAWEVRGDEEGSGSDSVSGTALVTMFEFAFTNNPADKVTAQIAKGSEPGLAGSFSVVKEDGMRWGWLVSKPAPDQAAAIGTGTQTSRGAATLAALGAIAPFTDWIVNLPSAVGGEAPVGAAMLVPFEQRDGLTITSAMVTAFDLPTWLAHAGPIVLQVMAQPPTSEQAAHVFAALGLPVDRKYTGKTYAQVLSAMSSTLTKWSQNKYLDVSPVEYTLAAQAIGATIPLPGKTGRVQGKPIVVRVDGSHWDWFVWSPGNRRADEASIASGEALSGQKAWIAAIEAAKKAPDLGLGPQQDQPGKKPCKHVKTTTLSQNLPATSFEDRTEREIKIWTAPTTACTRYTLRMGVCLIPSGGGTFGALDFYTKHQQGDGPLVAAEQDEAEFRISRLDGTRVDWDLFKVPVTWKRQYELQLRYVNGALDVLSTTRIDAPEVDACSDRVRRWPGRGNDRYKVGKWKPKIGEDVIDIKNWVSQPEFSVKADGKKLIVVIAYMGLPRFKAGTAPSQFKLFAADESKKTAFTVGFKIHAEGHE